MARVLVIGATGNIGAEVVRQLTATDVRVRATSRHAHPGDFPPNVEPVQADLTAPDTLGPALDEVDAVCLVWQASAEAAEPALVRILKQVRRVVFLSAPLKTPHPLFQQPNPSRDIAVRIEQMIETSAREWTFLRPGMFAINALHWWRPQIRAGDTVRWPYLDVPTAPIHERDIAAIAVHALCEAGHDRAEYVLTGPEALTQRDQIATIARVLGRDVPIEEIAPEHARDELTPILSARVAKMLVDAWAAPAGRPAWITSTVADVTGRPARAFADCVADHAADFGAYSRTTSS